MCLEPVGMPAGRQDADHAKVLKWDCGLPFLVLVRTGSKIALAALPTALVSLLAVLGGVPAAPAVAADAPSVTASPSDRSVVAGRKLRVRGRVAGLPLAPVRVRLRTGRSWTVLARGRAGLDGRYDLRVPTSWYWSGRLHVHVPAGPGRSAARSPEFRSAVRPGYRPRGRARTWTDLSGVGARWNGCRAITWRMNTAGMPWSGRAEVRRALRLMHAATGFRFRYVGTTSALPWNDLGRLLWGSADLTVAWSTARAVPELGGRSTVGVGGARWERQGDQPAVYVAGGAVLERWMPSYVHRGFVAGPSTGTLLLHELGHAMGLGHVNDRTQVMNPSLTALSRPQFGAGDLAGLRALGRMAGCA
jgi:hypothetical protein